MRDYTDLDRQLAQDLLIHQFFYQLLMIYGARCRADIRHGRFDDLKALKLEGLQQIVEETVNITLREMSWLMLLYNVEFDFTIVPHKDDMKTKKVFKDTGAEVRLTMPQLLHRKPIRTSVARIREIDPHVR